MLQNKSARFVQLFKQEDKKNIDNYVSDGVHVVCFSIVIILPWLCVKGAYEIET